MEMKIFTQPEIKINGVGIIITETNEKWFKKYGRFTNGEYDKRMESLMEGAPIVTLGSSQCAREIMGDMLIHPHPVRICGSNGAGLLNSDVIIRKFSLPPYVEPSLRALYCNGLLDIVSDGSGSDSWVFNSELVAVTPMHTKVVINKPLRATLEKTLSSLKLEVIMAKKLEKFVYSQDYGTSFGKITGFSNLKISS